MKKVGLELTLPGAAWRTQTPTHKKPLYATEPKEAYINNFLLHDAQRN